MQSEYETTLSKSATKREQRSALAEHRAALLASTAPAAIGPNRKTRRALATTNRKISETDRKIAEAQALADQLGKGK